MVAGMSVKGSEPQSGTSTHQSRRPGSTGQHTKSKPPVEAMQMARILDDSRYPADLNDKIKQVHNIVPDRSEEEICIALHDNDYEPVRAISALLDNDTPRTGGEWTTSGGRKGKRKGGQNDGIDLIVPSGDTKSHSKKGGQKGTNARAASQSTRENYGGSVHVSGSEKPKGRVANGRGRSHSGRRSDSSSGKQSGNSGDRERRGRSNRDKSNKTSKPPLPPTDSIDEVWDSLPVDEIRGQEVTANDWNDSSWTQQNNDKTQTYWDVAEDPPPVQDESVAEQPVFPEAIPSQQTSLQLSTPSETTPPLVITDRDHSHPQLQARNEGQSLREDDKKRKHKRIARSQIPTKPVEMPGEGDTLDLQFGSLGIDFGGSDGDHTHSTSVATGYVTDPILSYSDVHRLSDDPGVISVSSPSLPNSTIAYRLSETTPTTLEGPPGLTHPSSHDLSHDRSLESHDQRLQLGVDTTSSGDQLTVSSEPLSTQTDVLTAPSGLTESNTVESNASVLQAPEPIEMPQTKVTSSTQGYSVSGSDLLLSAPTSHTTHTSTQSATLPPTSTGSHQAGKPGTIPPGMVYPHMVPQYPAFMPMYPAAAPANYGDPSDISRYQASVSLAYYQGGGADPSLSAAGGGRGSDHYTNQDKFGRSSEVTPSVSQSSGQPSQQQQQQQQQQAGVAQNQQMQPAFMNYMNYPSNMFYPAMYFPHSMPKPSPGASTYPGVSTYQGAGGHMQVGSGYTGYDDVTSSHDYSKMYTASGVGTKSTNVSKTTAGDIGLSSAYKQPHYENKTSSNYQGFGVPQSQQYMGAYMQMPAMHPIPLLPGGSSHDSSGSGRVAQKHSSKGGGYQSSGAYWGGQGGHTS